MVVPKSLIHLSQLLLAILWITRDADIDWRLWSNDQNYFTYHNAMHSLDYVYLLLKNVLSFFTSSSHFHMVVSPSVRGNTHTQQHIC